MDNDFVGKMGDLSGNLFFVDDKTRRTCFDCELLEPERSAPHSKNKGTYLNGKFEIHIFSWYILIGSQALAG
jgi:hypothetical protein